VIYDLITKNNDLYKMSTIYHLYLHFKLGVVLFEHPYM